MNNELSNKQDAALQNMINATAPLVIPELDLSVSGASFPIENLSALGVAFQPLVSAIQTAVSGGGGSGLYFVNTNGKQMFSTAEGFIGSLKTAAGKVGGGQARMTQLPCDPTMLFMAVVLMNVEKKLDTIQATQKDILAFLEEKERAILQGDLNTLGDILNNLKYNWDNATYKTNKHNLVQQIRKEAESSIILYREQISQKIKKRSSFHSDKDVQNILDDLQSEFKDYQLALYIYAYATFLEIMLLGNFDENYLTGMENRISDYSHQYRTLYTDCYNMMETYASSSLQAGVLSGLANASKFIGTTLEKIPIVSKSTLDENLIAASTKLNQRGEKRTVTALGRLTQAKDSVILPFVENIKTINTLCNQPVAYLFDKENLYIQPAPSN